MEKAIKIIFEIWAFIRRRKTLNYLLFICIGLIAREITNLSTNLGPLINYFIELNPDINKWIKVILKIGVFIFSKGSWIALIIYIILFLSIAVLKYFEINSVKNASLINHLNNRIQTLEDEKSGISRSRQKEKDKFEREKVRIIDSLKRQGVSTEKLIQQYDRPLNVILISYASQHVPTANGGNRSESFLMNELLRYDVVSLGATDFLIPPNKVPKWIKNKENLEKWFESDILKGRYCKVKFLILLDIKSKVVWKTYLPYAQKAPKHFTIGERLTIDQLFSEDEIKKIALGDIIKNGDLLWLSSTFLTADQQAILQKNQSNIEHGLSNPSLIQLASDNIKPKLIECLSEYFDNQTEDIVQRITKEAKYWKRKLY